MRRDEEAEVTRNVVRRTPHQERRNKGDKPNQRYSGNRGLNARRVEAGSRIKGLGREAKNLTKGLRSRDNGTMLLKRCSTSTLASMIRKKTPKEKNSSYKGGPGNNAQKNRETPKAMKVGRSRMGNKELIIRKCGEGRVIQSLRASHRGRSSEDQKICFWAYVVP